MKIWGHARKDKVLKERIMKVVIVKQIVNGQRVKNKVGIEEIIG